MIDKHVELIARAADQGAEVVCLQELFYGPYFCAEQEMKWYDMTESVPDGPTVKLMPSWPKSIRWSWSSRSMRSSRRGSTTTRRP